MTHDVLTQEQETLAALYALGSLESGEAQAFARHLADDACDVCRVQVEAMAGVCGDLALAPSPSRPSPAVRGRVLAQAAHGRTKVVRSFAFMLEKEGDWIEIQPGVQQKTLVTPTGDDGSSSYLVRIAPGAQVAMHAHERFEHCYLIAGDLVIAGRHIHGGDYHYAPRGSVHESARSDGGCLLLIVEAP